TPRWRSQIFAICSDASRRSPSRLSILTKSFPAPFIFVKRSMASLLPQTAAKANVGRARLCRAGTCFGFTTDGSTESRPTSCVSALRFYLCPHTLRKFFAIVVLFVCAFNGSKAQMAPGKYNSLILDQIRAMPTGGKYSASRAATIRLQSAAHFESGIFSVVPDAASPSYCSGATYLVFIKTIEALRARGALSLSYATLDSLLIRNQRDGEGVWGRWNANGPGTARLFHEMDLGENFDDFAQAQAGDF